MEQAAAAARKEQVVSRFNATAGAYDRNRAVQICATRLLELAALQPGERVLDVACGTGNVALAAAGAVGPGGRVVGIDLTEGMLNQARRKAKERALTNIEFLIADAERLDLQDATFDAVTCGLGLQFVPNPPRAARE